MENQYCKVGAITPITSGAQALTTLEHRYQNFLKKATTLSGRDARMVDFIDAKIKGLKKTLESLM